jgi:hypothetical protein
MPESKITSQDPQGQAEPTAPDYEPGSPVFDPDGKEAFVHKVFVRQGRPWLELRTGFGCWADAVRPRTLPENQSALPWSARKDQEREWWHIRTAKGMPVVTCYLGETARLDADLIVRAVNALEPLLSTLEQAQAKVLAWILPGSRVSEREAMESLLDILDNQDLVKVMRAARGGA